MAEYPATWSWNRDGPKIRGEVLSIRHNPDAKFGPVDIMEIASPEEGEVSVWLSPAALKRWMSQSAPQQGDTVEIEFIGWEDVLDRETGQPKPHPERPNETWQMRTFRAEIVRGDTPSPFPVTAKTWPDDDEDIPF